MANSKVRTQTGRTYADVATKEGMVKFAVPVTSDQYVIRASRDCAVVRGISPAYKAWVSKRLARALGRV